jgi:hypothetical protein|nr:MAG TPA: hypothetical protein [Crassvirales sp.]
MGRYINAIIGVVLMKILLSVMTLGLALILVPVVLIIMREILFRYESDSDSIRGVLLGMLGAIIAVILK